MLRRLDGQTVTVWLACREACLVALTLFEGEATSSGPGASDGLAPVGSGTATTRRLGEGLHVALVRAGRPEGAANNPGTPALQPGHLRPGARYSYDVVLAPVAGGAAKGLLALGLLEDDPKGDDGVRKIENISPLAPAVFGLGGGEKKLPGFVAPPAALDELRIAHASCRKAHGSGTDALSWLDDALAGKVGEPPVSLGRPHQLFLTGDQIYADDVPTALLHMVQQLAADLMGGTEQLPRADGSLADVTATTVPPLRRTVLIRGAGGFTSVEAQNHLLTFGEYAAMYLLAWSPLCWRAVADLAACSAQSGTAPGPFPLTDLDALLPAEGGPGLPGRIAVTIGPGFEAERQRLRVFAATVGKVARVLANTPTLMIFDDHDVTDDWNINAAWERRVLTKPLGVAVMRNALVAYTFFQAWGSDWPSFEKADSPNRKLLEAATGWLANTRDRDAARQAELDELLGLTMASRKPEAKEKRATFHYTAPGQVHAVRVLDSRTRRTFPQGGVEPARLLGDTLEDQVPDAPARNAQEVLLVIASTPVLGPEIMERMIQPLAVRGFDVVRAWKGRAEDADAQPADGKPAGSALAFAAGRTRGDFFADTESWPSNEAALQDLLARLANHPRVVVLGGDVHYGLSLAMDRWARKQGAWEASRIVQLTSSASRNALLPEAEAIYRGWHWLNLWMAPKGVEGVGWKGKAKLTVPDDADLSLLQRRRLEEEEPALLRTAGWPQGVAEDAANPPDWAWRMITLRDIRPDEARGAALAEPATRTAEKVRKATDLPRGLERAQRAADAHAAALGDRFMPLREAVLTNNVGIIRFQLNDAGEPVAVVHDLISTTRRDYPEDKVVPFPADKPFGFGADLSKGHPHTNFVVPLAVDGTRPTLPPAGA
ncbi:hypothetical protein ACLF3G_21615 [Falsiroseomonas sp. HC035]|uniref:hypothetical protein n=1 Tax=Falsiroseomonas sp. HC035 TaxID=3390999 RepID=UPI003D31B0A2